ncbi:MAG: protein kinase [Phycisphaerae bacterium]|jgi:WD40 repeat protein/tetratricopeptide (TPR) repeat protein
MAASLPPYPGPDPVPRPPDGERPAPLRAWQDADSSASDSEDYSPDEPTRVSRRPPIAPDAPRPDENAIEGYQLIEEIHRGGQGVVYRAVQLGTKRQVALKVLLEGPFASDAARRRFEREIELAASLLHPAIVTILDSGISRGRYYFAMEFVDGLRLDRYLAKVRPPLKDTLRLFTTIANAVNFAHQRGVIHRDLKPPNILVDQAGEPHILDFGLAKPVQHVPGDKSTIQALSTAGELLGTVAYMSPEQTQGSMDVDVRSDVYSLGVVFYEALLGQLPYSVDGPLGEVLQRIAQADPIRPRSLRGQSRFGRLLDDELETILLKALEKHPVRRYQTAGDLARDLTHLVRGEPIEAKRASGLYMLRKTLGRYRLQATAAAVLLLTMVLFLVAFAFLWQAERESAYRADEERKSAQDSARDARQAQNASERAREELRRALVGQTIQRGDLAFAQGDLTAARDLYWQAREQSDTPATRWALRQYYDRSGDLTATVLQPRNGGPVAFSPDEQIAAVCHTPAGITIHDLATGGVRHWVQAPGPVTALSVDETGTVSAAGRGWARLWAPSQTIAAVSGEFGLDVDVTLVQAVSGGRRLLAVGSGRVMCFEGRTGTVRSTTSLLRDANGPPVYSPVLDQVAIPTVGGVQRIQIADDGTPHTDLIGLEKLRPRLLCFAGTDLLAMTEGAVYRAATAGTGPRAWTRVCNTSREWDFFDADAAGQTLLFGTHDGQVAVQRPGELEEIWDGRLGELRTLRLAGGGDVVTTLDQRGIVSRWLPLRQRQTYRRITDGLPAAWACAEDGSSVLVANARQRVAAYTPSRSTTTEMFSARRPFSLRLSTTPDTLLMAVSNLDRHSVICTGDVIRLRDTVTGTTVTTDWPAPDSHQLQQVAITGDGQLVAFAAQTPAGDQQRVSFRRWQPTAPGAMNVTLDTALPPSRPPVEFVGSLIRQIAFRPGTNRLLVARSNGELLWLDGAGGNHDADASPPAWLRFDSPPLCMAFDRRGQRLAAACADGFVRLLRTSDGHELLRLRLDGPARMLAFDPAGDTLLACLTDGSASLYELAAGEHLAQMAPPAAEQPGFGTWIGGGDRVLLGSESGVQEHAFDITDQRLQQNRVYARQRAVARHLADGDPASAWTAANLLEPLDPQSLRDMRRMIVEAALSRPGQDLPDDWVETALESAAPPVWLRLGTAAYAGERFELAHRLLTTGQKALADNIDARTALLLAQCAYLSGEYAEAADLFAAVQARSDFNLHDAPNVQLQQVAALVMAGRLPEARDTTAHIGAGDDEQFRLDLLATTSARGIARYLTGLESELPTAEFILRALTGLESDNPAAGIVHELTSTFVDSHAALRLQNDTPFFAGELARQQERVSAAAAAYQRCIDLTHDQQDIWPANWARYRLRQLSRGLQ